MALPGMVRISRRGGSLFFSGAVQILKGVSAFTDTIMKEPVREEPLRVLKNKMEWLCSVS